MYHPSSTAGIVCGIAIVLLAVAIGPIAAADPVLDDPARVQRWTEDIEFFARELPESHINLFFTLSEDDFRERIDALKAGIPTLEDYEILVSMMRIVAAIGDSHTMLTADNTGIFHRLPLSLTWYSDGLYVTRTIGAYRDILGKRLTAIEGNDIEAVSRVVSEVVAFDNPSQLRLRAPQNMVIPEILLTLGLAAGRDSVLLDVEGAGTRWLVPVEAKADLKWISLRDELDCAPPLYRQHADSIYWYRYLADSKTVYVQYRACVEMKDRPFSAFAGELLDFIEARDVDKAAIDLRLNGGGNSRIAGPLIQGLKRSRKVNQDGRLFVIIGRRTFSSAMLNALDLRDNTSALFVGEETGGKPNHFGEVGFFMLKGSGAIVTYSKKHFVRYSIDEPSLRPDIDVDMSFSDYESCRDPALEAILAY
ncbi:hypothetical protein ACFL2Z_03030 [Candidatus Eisenbacteria bacterium]|uniref:Tail specific protease domain-containing protein n=1 Tax=Eiseniibacteriota bacterium TaxID=2212470 RepID=A0ABV6YP74_UNCEI